MAEKLATLLAELKEDEALSEVRKALDEGTDPLSLVEELREGMSIVGKRFEDKEYFLSELIMSAEIFKESIALIEPHLEEGELFVPELMLSARATLAALEILRPHLAGQGVGAPGKVVLGTAQGDIHDIGKNIVGIVLEGDGFEVHDLGGDVPPQDFLDKAREVGADVVGISALISLAVSKMAETVAVLRQSDLTAKVIVGGAALTPNTAESIGADAYGRDAWEALRCVRRIVRGELQT
jgi:5-methyltetrahydrofolate--homocysteine methyltransferase